MTDDGDGLDPGISTLPLPDIPLPRERWTPKIWPKLSLFHPDLFPRGRLILFIDLDVMILAPLDPFIERSQKVGGLHVIREWSPSLWRLFPEALRPYRGSNSSVIAWRAGEQTRIWETFRQDPEGTTRRFNLEQDVLNAYAHPKHHWPGQWCQSFKRSCVFYPPLNRVIKPKPPRHVKILVFHGKPRPTDVMQAPGIRWGSRRKYGYEPIPWVREYWRQYGGSLT